MSNANSSKGFLAIDASVCSFVIPAWMPEVRLVSM
jgi:hypothetical protein